MTSQSGLGQTTCYGSDKGYKLMECIQGIPDASSRSTCITSSTGTFSATCTASCTQHSCQTCRQSVWQAAGLTPLQMDLQCSTA